MKVYSVNAGDGEPDIAFATKGAAMKHARDMQQNACPAGGFVEVDEVTLVPLRKATIVRLINAEGRYVAESTRIASLPSKRKEPD